MENRAESLLHPPELYYGLLGGITALAAICQISVHGRYR